MQKTRGRIRLRAIHTLAYRPDSPREDLSFDRRDNAHVMPKAVVVDVAPSVAANGGGRLVAWEDTIIYEAHVKGLTRLRNDIPAELRGTFRRAGSAGDDRASQDDLA